VTDFKTIVFENFKLLEAEAGRRFKDAPMALESTKYVLDAISNPAKQEKWENVSHFLDQKFPDYETNELHRAKKEKYLKKIFRNLIYDFIRARFGNIKPRTWIKRKGSLWLEVFKRLCVERMTIDDAIESIKYNTPFRKTEIITEAIIEIKTREPECGNLRGYLVSTPHEDLEILSSDSEQPLPSQPEDTLKERDKRNLLEITFRDYFAKNDIDLLESATLNKLLDTGVELKPEERILLRLLYEEDMPLTQAARRMNLTRDQARGNKARALDKLRQAYKKAGLEQQILDFLNP
jgi:RNA polymerase sigma factor (sigma-70 family)